MFLYSAMQAAFDAGQVDFDHKLIGEYHAEVEESDKLRILAEFSKPDSKIRCLISTVAFGMGVDIPDVRLIVHWGESDTVAQFWQEVGRGGRDGLSADAHLYHSQLHLRLCQQDMKDMITEVNSGSCIRHAVLKRLALDVMDSISSTPTADTCCNICINNSRVAAAASTEDIHEEQKL